MRIVSNSLDIRKDLDSIVTSRWKYVKNISEVNIYLPELHRYLLAPSGRLEKMKSIQQNYEFA